MAADPNVSAPRPDDAPGGHAVDPTVVPDAPADAPAGPDGAGAASAGTAGAGADGPALHGLERAARVPGEATLADRVKTFSVAPLPHHALSRAVLWATRRRSSLVTPVVRARRGVRGPVRSGCGHVRRGDGVGGGAVGRTVRTGAGHVRIGGHQLSAAVSAT